MGYSIDPISADCYPGTTILINKFNVRDEEKLNEIESVISSARNAEWLSEPKTDAFDFGHYMAIRNAGYHISFADMDTELLIIATIQSAQGVTDLLKQIFQESIQ